MMSRKQILRLVRSHCTVVFKVPVDFVDVGGPQRRLGS